MLLRPELAQVDERREVHLCALKRRVVDVSHGKVRHAGGMHGLDAEEGQGEGATGGYSGRGPLVSAPQCPPRCAAPRNLHDRVEHKVHQGLVVKLGVLKQVHGVEGDLGGGDRAVLAKRWSKARTTAEGRRL